MQFRWQSPASDAQVVSQVEAGQAGTGLGARPFLKVSVMDRDSVSSVPVDDPYAEFDSMAVDVFRAVAIGVVILSIARPLLKLAGIVVICVLVLLFV